MEDQDPFKEFGGTVITKSEQDKDPFAEFGGKTIKKKIISEPTTGGSASRSGGSKTGNPFGFASGLQPEAFDFTTAPVPQQQPQVPQFTPTLGRQQQVGLTPQLGVTGGFMQDIQANQEGRYSPNQEAMSQKLNKINQMYDKAQGKSATQQAQQATRTQGEINVGIPSEEREGNKAKYVYNKLLNGIGELANSVGDLGATVMAYSPNQGYSYNETGQIATRTAEEIKSQNQILTDYRKNTAGQVRDYLKNIIGADVDKGLEAKYDNDFLTSSIGGLANSVPAMVLPPALRTAGFILQGYDMGLRSVEANDQKGEIDDLTKSLYAAGVGTASGLLEKLGFDKLLGAATPSVATTLTNKALREIYEATNGKVTADALTRFLNTNIKDFAEQYAKRGVRALEGFGIEAATGGAQEVANIGSEYLLNKATGKSVFDTKDMSTWDGFVDNLKRVAYAAAQEGVGGGIVRGLINPKARAAIETNEQTLDGINNELERTDIPDSVKEVLVKRKIELQSEIDAGVQEAERNYNRLNPAQQERVNELGERIAAFDEAIADPNVSEEVKKDLQQQADVVEKEIESIKPETKETITPIISSSDVAIGDEVQLENGKRGIVTEIDGENIKFDLADGGVITTSKPEFLGMSKVNVEEQVAEAPVVEETVTEELPTTGKATIQNKEVIASDGQKYANNPRIRYYAKIGEEVRNSLPSIKEGYTRLFRGNREGEVGDNPSFTNSLEGIALPFLNDYKGKLSYVDVPNSDLSKYEQTNGVAPGAEFFVTPEIAKGATEISRDIIDKYEDLYPNKTLTEQEFLATKPKSNEIKPSEVATEKIVETPAVSEARTEEVVAKADKDLEALKQVKDKTKKHEASLKRLTEAKNSGEITEKQFNSYKKKFDEVLTESNVVDVTDIPSEKIPAKVSEENNFSKNKQFFIDVDDTPNSDTAFNTTFSFDNNGTVDINPKNIERAWTSRDYGLSKLYDILQVPILPKDQKIAIITKKPKIKLIDGKVTVVEKGEISFGEQEIKTKIKEETTDALEEQSTTSVDVREQAKDGERMGEGDTQRERPTQEVPSEKVQQKEVKAGDAARQFAEKIRSGKINKLGGFKTSTGFDAVWDLSLETVAQAIDGGARILDAIESGLNQIKKTDWYKNIDGKEEFDELYRSHLKDSFVQDTRYWNNAGKAQLLNTADLKSRIKELEGKTNINTDEGRELSALTEENTTRLKQKLLDSDITKATAIIAEMKESGRQVIPAKQLVVLEDVIERYNNPLKLSNADLKNDVKESILRLSKTVISDNTYYADKITLREAVKELAMRDFSNQEIVDLAKAEFDKYKYTPDKTNAKIETFLNPLLTQVKRPLSKEIRSFAEKIRNGKINKLGGFRVGTGFDAAWDLGLETVALSLEGGAKVAEAIENGLEAIKKTDWYKNLTNQEEFDIQYRDHLNSEYTVEDRTTLRNADVAERRKDYGFEERVMPDKVSNPEMEAKADVMLSEGYDVEDLIDRINEGKPVTAEESVLLAKYQGVLQEKLIEYNRRMENNVDAAVGSFERLVEQRNKAIDDLIRAYDASEMSGTISARALQARRIAVLQDYSLANLFIRKRKAQGNVDLTDQQKQEITNTYNKLKETEQQLADKIAQLDAKTAELNALNATKRMKRDIEADRRKNRRNQTKDALREERKSIFSEISKLANKSRGEVSANPIPLEMIPLIGRLARNYYADGVVSLEQIVDNIHKDLVDYVDGVTKRDVRDAISGYGLDSRATRDELRQQIQDLKTQAKLISQIEDAEAGLSKVRPEQRKAASEEVEMLRARLKDLTRSEDQLYALKNRLNKQIKDTQKKLDNRDYSKKEVFETELDDEARKLQDAYRKIKYDFEVAVQKDILAHRTKAERYRDIVIDVLNVPRSLMATADFSAPLRQGVIPTVSNPLMAGRAFSESLKQWASKGRADRWLADLKESDGYQLMKDSKLYIAENNNAKVAAREEDFSSNLAGKIPVIGKLVDASERNYNGFLNKMRVDLFTRGVDVLQDQGMSYANNPDAFKALASYINSSTGRGDLGALNTAAPILNSMFFSPRLMASRLGLLMGKPLWYKSTPKAVKMMYIKDMAKFVGFGISILALAAVNGADVERDPRSPDFGKIKRGDTRWDIWAGFQQYVRLFAQQITGEKKSSASGNITKLDGTSYTKETRLSNFASFIRGKFAPVPALITNALSGSNVIGEPFSLQNEIPKMLAPLVYQSIYESSKTDGWPFAIGATGIPSMLGVGVQTYGVNNFLQKGVDDKLVDLLTKKKAVAIEPKEGDKEIYDLDTGEERDMTTAEYKKYYDVWSESIKANLKDNYKEYEKMSVGEFEKAFRSIKMNATKEAKAVVSGVTQGEKTIREGDTTFDLTPKQIELRQSIKKDFIKENGKDILEGEKEKALAEGKSAGEAERLAKKKLESEANAYSKQVFLEKEEEGNKIYKLNKEK